MWVFSFVHCGEVYNTLSLYRRVLFERFHCIHIVRISKDLFKIFLIILYPVAGLGVWVKLLYYKCNRSPGYLECHSYRTKISANILVLPLP